MTHAIRSLESSLGGGLQAFLSQRVVTPGGIQPAAILVEAGQIQSVVPPDGVPVRVETHDFGEAAILPGLVDPPVHINDPGRADWEGFETATRAAAAGGYTLLVDMPLNCLPATTSVFGHIHQQGEIGRAHV